MKRELAISDITIKIADSKPQCGLPFRKTIELSKMLDDLGLSVIEVGPLLNGKSDSLLVKSLSSAIKNATLAVPVEVSNPESLDLLWDSLKGAAHPRIQVSAPVSTVQMEYLSHLKPEVLLGKVVDLIERSAGLCKDVEFIAEDFTRCDEDFFKKIVDAAIKAGATTVTVRDSAGQEFPLDFMDKVASVRNQIPEGIRLGVWCSNSMFIADACALASIKAGVDELKVSAVYNDTVSLKRIVSILKAKEDYLNVHHGVRSSEILRECGTIKEFCKSESKSSVCGTESYASSDEEASFTVKDGLQTISNAVASLGYQLSEEALNNVYETFCSLVKTNSSVSIKELDAIVASVAFQAPSTYALDTFLVNSGNVISATCHLKLRKNGESLECVCIGDGPVDAAFLAIEQLVDKNYELEDFQIRSVTQGREAMGEALVKLRYKGVLYSGKGISTDIVCASIMAHLNAVNRIVFEEE